MNPVAKVFTGFADIVTRTSRDAWARGLQKLGMGDAPAQKTATIVSGIGGALLLGVAVLGFAATCAIVTMSSLHAVACVCIGLLFVGAVYVGTAGIGMLGGFGEVTRWFSKPKGVAPIAPAVLAPECKLTGDAKAGFANAVARQEPEAASGPVRGLKSEV